MTRFVLGNKEFSVHYSGDHEVSGLVEEAVVSRARRFFAQNKKQYVSGNHLERLLNPSNAVAEVVNGTSIEVREYPSQAAIHRVLNRLRGVANRSEDAYGLLSDVENLLDEHTAVKI